MKSVYSIVGMKYRGTEKLVRSLPNGEPIELIREPDNPHDKFAVQVWARGQCVAYVKGTEANALARYIDADPTRKQHGIAGSLVAREWPMVEVET